MAKKFFGNNTLSSFIDNLLGTCPSKELSEDDTKSLWGEINKPVEPEPEPITEVAWIWGVASENDVSAIFNNQNKNVSIKDITTNTTIYNGTTNSMSQFNTNSDINLCILNS